MDPQALLKKNEHASVSTNVNKTPRYNIYRVVTSGEPAIVLQAKGCCMADKKGKLSNEVNRTVQNQIGEQGYRAFQRGHCFHFHMNKPQLVDASIQQAKPAVIEQKEAVPKMTLPASGSSQKRK